MQKKWLYLLLLLTGYLVQACSTTEQQVEQNIENLAAHPIKSEAWQQSVDALVDLGRPAARQLIAHLDPAFYKGVNYREFRGEIEQIRTGCARALGRLKHRAAAASLKDRTAVTTYTDTERLASIWAVGELGFNQAAVDKILPLLADKDQQIRLYTAIALVKMGQEVDSDLIASPLESQDNALSQLALEQLATTNYAGVPLLLDMHQTSTTHQPQIKEVLAQIRQQLVGQLTDDDPVVRQESARALGQIGDPAAAPALQTLLQDPSNLVRFNAAAALAQMDQSEGIDFLFDALISQDPILRVNAVTFLVAVQRATGSVQAKLIQTLSHTDPLGRSGAAQVLGRAQVQEALGALTKIVADQVAEVRWNGALALGQLAAPESRPVLEGLLKDSDDTVIYYARWALGQLQRS